MKELIQSGVSLSLGRLCKHSRHSASCLTCNRLSQPERAPVDDALPFDAAPVVVTDEMRARSARCPSCDYTNGMHEANPPCPRRPR